MKQTFSAALTFLMIVVSFLSFATVPELGHTILVHNLAIYENQTLTDRKAVISILADQFRDQTVHVDCNLLLLVPDHKAQLLRLEQQHFSTDKGNIRNVIITKDVLGFDLYLNPPYLPEKKMKIICKQFSAHGLNYVVAGKASWPVLGTQERVNTEWRVIRTLELPYSRIESAEIFRR